MKRFNHIGFTIIEIMLFLSISGVLVVGMLVGAGYSINVQRYNESVRSLQSMIQKQYSEVMNVVSEKNNKLCSINGVTSSRGQSDCIMLGRYITTNDGGRNISIRTVVGVEPISLGFVSDDTTALQRYNIKISSIDPDSYSAEWGTSLVQPMNGNNSVFSMLILRSPTSGTIRTYINPTASVADNSLSTLLTATNLSNPVKLCVTSNGLVNTPKSAVFINANSSSPTGIETMGGATSGC